jgi:hypothetical protein
MNTEAMNVLKQIRETTNQLQQELDGLYCKEHPEQKELLERILNNLYDQEDLIINNAIQQIVNQLKAGNQSLQLLIGQMDKEVVEIAKLNEAVKKASSMIAALVKITTLAVSAGLI